MDWDRLNISENGIALIKESESCRLDSFQDSVGVWTIGFGHTGPEVKEGLHITQDAAEALLLSDLETVEKCIANSVSVNLTQGQYDALCSFVFNLGCSALRNSTLLRLLNAGDDVGASEQFKRWDHAGGKVLAGLTKRREAEAEMFMNA
jgi:lysozyme